MNNNLDYQDMDLRPSQYYGDSFENTQMYVRPRDHTFLYVVILLIVISMIIGYLIGT